jgi:hypothetical protein
LKIKERQKEEAMYMEDTQKGWLEKRLKCSRLYFVFGSKERKKKTRDLESSSYCLPGASEEWKFL